MVQSGSAGPEHPGYASHLSQPVSPVFGRLFVRLLIPIVLVAGLFLVLGILYRSGSVPGTAISEADVARESAAKAPEVTPTYESLKPQYMEMAAGGARKLSGFNGEKYRGSKSRVEDELKVFQAWAIFLEEGERYPLTSKEREKINSLGQQVKKLQAREFPAMRAAWATGLRQSFGKYKLIASTSGDRNESLRVILPPTAGEAGLSACMTERQSETAAHLRFSAIHLTFTQGLTLTAPMKPSKTPPPPDSELVRWDGLKQHRINWFSKH